MENVGFMLLHHTLSNFIMHSLKDLEHHNLFTTYFTTSIARACKYTIMVKGGKICVQFSIIFNCVVYCFTARPEIPCKIN